MDRLITNFQKRDTKNNIIRLQEELDGLAAQVNPLKKCLSMYKIKEKMDKIENNTKEEEEQARKKKEDSHHAHEIGMPKQGANKGANGAKPATTRPTAQPLSLSEGKDISIEQEGRLRYKILTNFVNAYKDKMFLSNSPGKGHGGNDIMTLEDLKMHT